MGSLQASQWAGPGFKFLIPAHTRPKESLARPKPDPTRKRPGHPSSPNYSRVGIKSILFKDVNHFNFSSWMSVVFFFTITWMMEKKRNGCDNNPSSWGSGILWRSIDMIMLKKMMWPMLERKSCPSTPKLYAWAWSCEVLVTTNRNSSMGYHSTWVVCLNILYTDTDRICECSFKEEGSITKIGNVQWLACTIIGRERNS